MRRNGVGIGARKEKGRSEKRVKRGGRKEIGDRIFRSLDVCGSQSVLILFIAKTYRFDDISCPSYRLAGQLAGWLAGRLPAMHLGHQNASKTRTLSTKVRRKCVPLSRKSMSQVAYAYIALQAYKSVKNAYP